MKIPDRQRPYQADYPKGHDVHIDLRSISIRQTKAIDGGDAASQGIGIMTTDRWKATYDSVSRA